MVVLLERLPEGQNLPAAVAPSIGPVAPDQGVASQVGVFQAGLRSSGDINIPLPEDSISSQSPLYTEKDYRDAVDRMTGSFRDSGVDGQTVSEIVHDMNSLRDGDAEMMASVQNAADDIQNGNLNQKDRNVWEIIIDALKNITPEQRNSLLTDAGITYGAVAGFWLSRKYFSRIGINDPHRLKKIQKGQIAGLLIAAGSIACVIGGQVMATASQTAPAPDGSPPPVPTSPDRTATPSSDSTAPAPNATSIVESATPGSPDGYSPATLLGSKDAYNTVAEAIDQSGQPITETANSKYIKAHKFSEADLQAIVDSGSPQYGITVDIARNTLENITLMKNLTTVNVPGSRVYYFYNGLSGNDSRGFMLLVSADGNSVWQAKNKATGALNHFPNTFSGIDLSNNYTPDQLLQFVRPWQPADAEPQETDRLITQVDISTIGGIDQLNVVFQPGTENAFLVGTSNQVKSGIDVVKSVFDSSTGQWLEIVDLPKNAILPGDWATYTAEGENKGKYDPEMFFQLVGSINHQNRKTLALESNGMKIAFTVAEQYFKDNNIDPILGLTALSEADQQALAEALSLQLDNMSDLKAQLSAIRAQIEAKEGDLLSKDVTRYTVIIQNGQITGIVDMGTDSPRRYVLNAEGKLVRLASELEPQLLPELRVNGPYIERADTGEIVELKGLNVTDFAYDQIGSFARIWSRGLKTITEQKWPVNLLRVGINPKFYSSQSSELNELIDFAEKHGIYVVLTPNLGSEQAFLPPPETEGMMKDMATRFLNRNHVIYSLFNEPSPDALIRPWDDATSMSQAIQMWRNVAQPIADAIRTENSKAIIVVPGHTRSASMLGDYINRPFTAGGSPANIIYDVHVYGNKDKPDQQPFFNDSSFKLFVGQHKFPVLVGEMGGVIAGSPSVPIQGEMDIAYMQSELDFINQFPGEVHYAAWALDPWDRSGIFNPPDYKVLTPRGTMDFNDFSGNGGPDNFTK